MKVIRDDGRAMPPRPSLLVGDEAACHAAWPKLANKAAQLIASLPPHRTCAELELLEQALQQGRPTSSSSSRPSASSSNSGPSRPTNTSSSGSTCPLMADLLDKQGSSCLDGDLRRHRAVVESAGQLVGQLRFMRESLMSNHMLATPLACEVYEVSCDVAAAAGKAAAPELFKALQALVNELYPSSQQPTKEVAAPSSTANTNTITTTTLMGAGCAQQASTRQGEITAAYILFFAVSPSLPLGSELVAVLRSPHVRRCWDSTEVKWALQVLAALSCSNWARLFQLRACIPTRHATCSLSDVQRGDEASRPSPSLTSASPTGDVCDPSRLLTELLDFKLAQIRRHALAACACSYRSLPWRAAKQLLGLHLRDHHAKHHHHTQTAPAAGSTEGTACSTLGHAGVALSLCCLRPGTSAAGHADPWDEDSSVQPTGAAAGAAVAATGSSAANGQREGLCDQDAVLQEASALALLCGLLQAGATAGNKGAATALAAVQQAASQSQPVLLDLPFK